MRYFPCIKKIGLLFAQSIHTTTKSALLSLYQEVWSAICPVYSNDNKECVTFLVSRSLVCYLPSLFKRQQRVRCFPCIKKFGLLFAQSIQTTTKSALLSLYQEVWSAVCPVYSNDNKECVTFLVSRSLVCYLPSLFKRQQRVRCFPCIKKFGLLFAQSIQTTTKSALSSLCQEVWSAICPVYSNDNKEGVAFLVSRSLVCYLPSLFKRQRRVRYLPCIKKIGLLFAQSIQTTTKSASLWYRTQTDAHLFC